MGWAGMKLNWQERMGCSSSNGMGMTGMAGWMTAGRWHWRVKKEQGVHKEDGWLYCQY